jgi:hypothetical protein
MDPQNEQDQLLKLATHWKRRKPYTIASVGDILGGYVRKNLRRQKRRSPIVDAWKEVVPAALDEFCRIESFQGGILRVEVSDAAYRFQMETLKNELIESIKAQVKGKIGLRDIRFV